MTKVIKNKKKKKSIGAYNIIMFFCLSECLWCCFFLPYLSCCHVKMLFSTLILGTGWCCSVVSLMFSFHFIFLWSGVCQMRCISYYCCYYCHYYYYYYKCSITNAIQAPEILMLLWLSLWKYQDSLRMLCTPFVYNIKALM